MMCILENLSRYCSSLGKFRIYQWQSSQRNSLGIHSRSFHSAQIVLPNIKPHYSKYKLLDCSQHMVKHKYDKLLQKYIGYSLMGKIRIFLKSGCQRKLPGMMLHNFHPTKIVPQRSSARFSKCIHHFRYQHDQKHNLCNTNHSGTPNQYYRILGIEYLPSTDRMDM
jgi:hypothetical protein